MTEDQQGGYLLTITNIWLFIADSKIKRRSVATNINTVMDKNDHITEKLNTMTEYGLP